MNRWLLNVATSYARFIVAIGAVVFLTPVIIESIGMESYGVWAQVLATVGLLGLMDFGLATSAVKFIAEHTGQADEPGRNRVLSILLTVYTCIAAVIALSVLVAALVLPRLGVVDAAAGTGAAGLVLIMGGCVASSLYLGLFRATLAGAGLMYLANAVEIGMTALNLLLVLALIDYGVSGLAFALLASTAAGVAGMALTARLRVHGLKLRLTRCKWNEVRELLSFSAWAFVANAAALAILRMDPIVIGRYLPLAAVAVYAVAGRVAEYAFLINKQFSNALMPLVSQAHGRGDASAVQRVLWDGTRYLVAMALPMLALLAFHAETLLVLWLGDDFRAAATPLRLLCAAVLLSVLQLNAANVLGMTGRHRFVATAMIAAAMINLALTLLLVPITGLTGAAIATLIAAATVETGVILPAACRHAGIRLVALLRHALLPAIAATTPALTVAALLFQTSPPASLAALLLQSMTAVGVAAPVFVFAGLSRCERQRIARALFRSRRHVPLTNEGAA